MRRIMAKRIMAKQPLTTDELIRQMAEDVRSIRRHTPGTGVPRVLAFLLISLIPVLLLAIYQMFLRGEFSMVSKKTVVAILAGVLIGTVGSSPVVKAQAVVPPLPVIDFAAIAKLLDEISLLGGIVDNSVKIYTTAKSELQAFQMNVTALRTKNWLSFVRGFRNDSIVNRFGETAAMQSALNSGSGVSSAWQKATLATPNLSNLSRETVGSSQHLAHLATMEMQDSAGMTALGALGDFRVTDAQNQANYAQLETLVLDTSPGSNTAAAQQNIANGVALQQLKAMRTQTGINAALLEQQLAANKYSRDSMASHLNLFSNINQLRGSSQNWMIDPDPSARNYLVP